MFSQAYYLIRSRTDGSYLAAYPKLKEDEPRSPANGYVLLFQEHFDALGYLNKFAGEMSDRFTAESIAGSQLNSLLDRWGYKGFGIVRDPLIPTIEFLSKA
jgi:predicted N-acyltransferase